MPTDSRPLSISMPDSSSEVLPSGVVYWYSRRRPSPLSMAYSVPNAPTKAAPWYLPPPDSVRLVVPSLAQASMVLSVQA